MWFAAMHLHCAYGLRCPDAHQVLVSPSSIMQQTAADTTGPGSTGLLAKVVI